MELLGSLQDSVLQFNGSALLPEAAEVTESASRVAYNTFFFFECYHFMTHMFVLFRVRLLPRKDLVRNRVYFLVDTTCVFVVNFILVKKLRLIACLQIAQHLFYYLTWDKSQLCKKVVTWSSLEWQRLPKQVSLREGLFEILGTIFDTAVHLVNAYMLAGHLQAVEVILGLALTHVFLQIVLLNPRFAWSEPSALPGWVEKRIQPLSKDILPLTIADRLLGRKGIRDADLAECAKKAQ